MSERILRPINKSFEELVLEAQLEEAREARASQPQQRFDNETSITHRHLSPREQAAIREYNESLNKNKLRVKKLRRVGGAVLAVSALAAGSVFVVTQNIGGVRDFFDTDDSTVSAIKAEASDLSNNGEKVFAQGNCTSPENIAIVVTVNAEIDMVPQLLTAESPDKPIGVGPYMTEANLKKMDNQASDDDEDAIDMTNFITGGYNEAHLVELPLALSVCTPKDSEAIINSPDKLTIDRDKFNIMLHDPNQLFDKNIIDPIYQDEGADAKPDASKNQFYTLPNPGYKFFISPSDDTVRNASVDAVAAAVYNETFEKALLYKLQSGVSEQLMKAKPGQDNIELPQGAISLEQIIDEHIKKIMRGDDQVAVDIDGYYEFTSDIAMNAAGTAKITDNDPTSGANPLNGIDPNQKVRLTRAIVELNTLVEPEVIETPEPTPEEVPEEIETAVTP